MKDISKTIEIKCDCSETVDFHELKDFQGGLKTRDKSDYEKMKTSILKYGWSFCLYYWNDGKDKYIIDGHNRRYVLEQLEKEGYFIPPIPAIEVFATDRAEAKQKLLRLNSTYGTLTADSVIEFVGNDFELETSEISLPSGVIDFSTETEEEPENLDDTSGNTKELVVKISFKEQDELENFLQRYKDEINEEYKTAYISVSGGAL